MVTGASSGIGAATARSLADAGFTVWAAARRTDRLAELAAESPAITAVSLDVTSPESVAELARSVNGEPDGLALLVNNAGAPSAWNRSRPRTPPTGCGCMRPTCSVPCG